MVTKAQKQQNEILNKAKEIRMDHHTAKGIDQEDMKSWDDLTGDKQARWVAEAREALGLPDEG